MCWSICMRVESAMSRSGLSKGTILELLPRHVTYLVSLMITGECSFLTGFILRILTSCSILTLSEKLGPDTRVYYFQLNQLLPILRFFDVSWSQVKPFELPQSPAFLETVELMLEQDQVIS